MQLRRAHTNRGRSRHQKGNGAGIARVVAKRSANDCAHNSHPFAVIFKIHTRVEGHAVVLALPSL